MAACHGLLALLWLLLLLGPFTALIFLVVEQSLLQQHAADTVYFPQGQKPPGAQGGLFPAAACSLGDFNAYDIGLYSEDSCSSSISEATQGLLQPVPSLPGLSEPLTIPPDALHAGHSGTVKLLKQQKATASTSANLSPTQHHAWRQGHASKPSGGLELLFALGSCCCSQAQKPRKAWSVVAKCVLLYVTNYRRMMKW